MMQIAVVHYHLYPGGVTRVIHNTVSALTDSETHVAVLVGDPPGTETAGLERLSVLPGLGYEGQRDPWSPDELAAELLTAAQDTLGQAPDIWHFHNHSIGKNLAVPGAICHLAESGHRVLLQIHDFAEDGRPANYRLLLEKLGGGDPVRLSALLYPQAEHVHYAVLNGRDRTFLERAGVHSDRLHLLPNAVWVDPQDIDTKLPEPTTSDRLWLYPTRAIRRKNLGEFLLLSALGDAGDQFATTLAPKNPRERPMYEHWVQVAEELGLPVSLGIAEANPDSFGALVASAHALITTSVAEGFGLAFLEPWLMGRAVTGRDLTEITGEFKEAGVELSGLYERLEVPTEWLATELLESKIRSGLEGYMQAYGRTPGAEDVERVKRAWIHGDRLDYGRLDEELQETVLRRVAASTEVHDLIRPPRLFDQPGSPDQIGRNRQAIVDTFGLDSYGKRLARVYDCLATSSPQTLESISDDVLLDEFLSPERLFLLRT